MAEGSFCFLLNKASDEDQNADEDQDCAAENTCFARELGSDLFANDDTAEADHEGDCGDQECTEKRFSEPIVCDGEADGKCVDRGRNALNEQSTEGYRTALLTLTASDAVDEHFRADIAEKSESDPRNEKLKSGEILYDRMDADPSDQGHERLKECENTGNAKHFTELHIRLVQAVCQRNRKGIHGEPYAKHDADKEKFQTEIH